MYSVQLSSQLACVLLAVIKNQYQGLVESEPISAEVNVHSLADFSGVQVSNCTLSMTMVLYTISDVFHMYVLERDLGF